MNRSAPPSKHIFACVAAIVIVAAVSAAAFPWGFVGHEIVTRRAVAMTNGELGGFLSANIATLTAFADEPDVLSEGNPDEGRNHFLDMDAFDTPPFSAIPLTQVEFVERFGKDALKEGRLPWAAADEYTALVAAMRASDGEGVLRHGGHLAHYAADSTMPLHATKNYKGQATGNVIFDNRTVDRHVHLRFEIGMIEANRDDIERLVRERAGGVHRIAGPAAEMINNLRNSYSLVDRLLAADREVLKPGNAVTPRYFTELYKRVGDVAVLQMAFAAGEVASFWQSAYEQAGSPRLGARALTVKTPPLSKDIVLNQGKAVTEKPQ